MGKNNSTLKSWVAFVKHVQKDEGISYKDAMTRAKARINEWKRPKKGGDPTDSVAPESASAPAPAPAVEEEEMVEEQVTMGGKRRNKRTAKRRRGGQVLVVAGGKHKKSKKARRSRRRRGGSPIIPM